MNREEATARVRARRAAHTTEEARAARANQPIDKCPDCGAPPRGPFDVHWFNDEDPIRSRWVCGQCFFKLTTEQVSEAMRIKAEATEAMRKQMAQEHIDRNVDFLQKQVEITRDKTRAEHVHKWRIIGQDQIDEHCVDMVFHCIECPHDEPIVKVIRVETANHPHSHSHSTMGKEEGATTDDASLMQKVGRAMVESDHATVVANENVEDQPDPEEGKWT